MGSNSQKMYAPSGDGNHYALVRILSVENCRTDSSSFLFPFDMFSKATFHTGRYF